MIPRPGLYCNSPSPNHNLGTDRASGNNAMKLHEYQARQLFAAYQIAKMESVGAIFLFPFLWMAVLLGRISQLLASFFSVILSPFTPEEGIVGGIVGGVLSLVLAGAVSAHLFTRWTGSERPWRNHHALIAGLAVLINSVTGLSVLLEWWPTD